MTDRASPPLPDEPARRLAREVFDRPVLLEAGAGTGKTRALVERLLAWTLDHGWSESERLRERHRGGTEPSAVAAATLDGVVAITFTDAAAAEMASRLAKSLGKLARREECVEASAIVARLGEDVVARRADSLLGALARARILTIHAFCRSLLAAHPFEAGLHPAFEIDADGSELDRIATEVLSARMSAALRAGDPDWLDLLGREHEPGELLEAVVASLSRGLDGDDFAADPFPAESVAARWRRTRERVTPLADALAAVVDRLAANARARSLNGELRELRTILEREPGSDALAEAGTAASEILEAYRETLRKWADGQDSRKILDLLPAAHGDFARLAEEARRGLEGIAGLDPEALQRTRRVVAPLVREVRERMRRDGYALFEDLLARAADLLDRRADVRRAVRRSIRQLLVDEFQDTDRRQCALLASLALDGEREERPGLFVVGDPKQSIYGWRRADLAAYEEFLAGVRASGPTAEGRLEVNFRSTPAILGEVERVLASAFRPEPGLQPPFEALLASDRGRAASARRGGRPEVEYWVSVSPRKGPKTSFGEATRIEARAIADDLLAERRRDPELLWSQVALLARASGDLEIYLQALREAGIPFAVERDRSYWRRREVIDAAAVVRATIDPGDRLALVTLLRSPFVGVPDAALLPLWREHLPERLDELTRPDPARLAALRELLERAAAETPLDVPRISAVVGWNSSAFAALEAIAELREAFGREPAEVFVERLRSRLALEPISAARYLGRFGVANLERFFADLDEALESSGDDPAAILRFLRRAVAESREAEEARPPAGDHDAVQVMTVHRAKGLEFRQVYLVQTHKGTGSDRRRPAIDSERLGPSRLAYKLLGHPNLDWAEAAEHRKAVSERELVRLLYVAMTRAEERLVVTGQLCARARDGSFRALLADRFELSPAAGLARAGGEPAELPAPDPYRAIWRAPALETSWSDEPRRFPEHEAAQAGDAARADEDRRRLADLRADAAERAARPRFVPASSLAGEEPELEDDLERTPAGRTAAGGPAAGAPPAPRSAATARALGTALHRALEAASSAPSRPWDDAARAAYRGELPVADEAELAVLDAALAKLSASRLFARLLSLADHVLARELPLLLAAPPEAGEGPIAGYTGKLDLLYRDPDGGQLVVADFKSDVLTSDEELSEVLARYRPQLELYGRAVREALSLPAPPRLELWLIDRDEIHVLEVSGTAD